MPEPEKNFFMFPCPECKFFVGGRGHLEGGEILMDDEVTCDCGWSSSNLAPEKKEEDAEIQSGGQDGLPRDVRAH